MPPPIIPQKPIFMFGAYVANISVSIGWGGQGGSLQATLVEDPANGVVIPKENGELDGTGNPFYGDPSSPSTGTPCFFVLGEFYFGGIFQRWTYKEDAVNGRTYDIILESPSKLMDGVQFIIENFNGATDAFANQYNQYQSSTNAFGGGNQSLFHATYGNTKSRQNRNGTATNIYNLFGYWENPFLGYNEAEGSDLFGDGNSNNPKQVYQNFGASGFNSSGTSILKLLVAADELMKTETTNAFGGGIQFGNDVGDNTRGTSCEYDFMWDGLAAFYSDQRITPDVLDNIRIQGPVKSVNGLLGELAEFHQFDYFYNILPDGGSNAIQQLLIRQPPSFADNSDDGEEVFLTVAEGGAGGGYLGDLGGRDVPYDKAEIHLQVVSKATPPVPNRLREFINEELALPDLERSIMSYDFGKEFADSTTQKLIWGSRRTRYIEINGQPRPGGGVNPSVAAQYAVWGMQNSTNTDAYNLVGTAGLVYGSLNTPRPIFIPGFGFYNATPLEMRMSLGGKTPWQIFKTFQTLAQSEPNGYNNYLQSPWTATQDVTGDLIDQIAGGNVGNAYDMCVSNLQKAYNQWLPELNELNDTIFSGVSAIANSSYKQEYYCLLPNEVSNLYYNVYYPDEESEAIKTWDIASSAFIQYGAFAPSLDVSFFDQSGKMVPVVGYPLLPGVDLSSLGSDYTVGVNGATGTIISKKGGPAGESYFYPSFGRFGTLFKTGSQPKIFDASTTPDFGLTVLADFFFGINIPPERYIAQGKESLQFQIPPDVLQPSYLGIAQESQRFNYGPWITLNRNFGGYYSAYGKAEVQEVTQLNPETFGNYQQLYDAGGIYASVANTDMYEAETGYCQMVGAPLWNLGVRFASLGPYVSSMDISIDATAGVTTSYKFNTWTPEFGKLSKYNVDRVAKTNRSAWSRAQQLRGKITKPPFPKAEFRKTDYSELNKAKASAAEFNAFCMRLEQQGLNQEEVE
jgi:hypothetical protein